MADKPNYITLNHLATVISALLNKIETKPDESDLANVAFTGNYTDLINKPYLGNYVTESALTDYIEDLMDDAYNYFQPALPSTNGNNGKFLSIDNGNLAWSSLGSIFTYKGTKTDTASLPSSGNTTGDVWIVTADNSEHVWNGSAWEELGPTTDLSIYMRKGVDYVTAGRKANTTAGNGTTAEGTNNTVIGPYSHAEGSGNTIQTQGNNAHAEGTGNLVTKASGHAEGENVQVTGIAAHAEGTSTTASGNGSHAEGYSTLAGAQNAHAEGRITSATGAQSHAEGFRAVASGDNAHAEGYYTTAQRKSQHVFGEYNILDTTGTGTTRGDYVEIVGNGTSTSDRSNARTLDWNGNEILAGKLTIGTGPTNNMDVATKQYVDNSIVNGNFMVKGVDYVTAGQLSGSTLGTHATAEGTDVTAEGTAAHAEGYETTVIANYGHAEGYKTTSDWEASHAEGRETFALGDSSHSEGLYTVDFSSGHAEGNGGINGSSGGHVEGIQSLISSVYLTGPTNDGGTTYTVNSYSDIPSYLLSDSSRLSYSSTVFIVDPETGEYSSRHDVINCSVSNNNLTSLTFSKTLGSLTNEPIELSIPNTLANGAHAEGNFTHAYGNGAHAEGNTNIATGNGAHAEGQGNQALNNYTHAEGTNTTANGEASHAEGNGTIANGDYQHTFGEYNIFDDVKYSRYGIPKGRMRGDMNGDGVVDRADAVVMNNYYRNIDRDIDSIAIWCGDVVVNNAINVTDYTALLQHLAGNSSPLTTTPTFADYYNNWTYVKVDDLNGYWTYNVTISSADATNLVDVYAANLVSYSLSGTTLTINVSRPPITDSSILIDVGSENGSYSKHIEIVGGGKTSTYLSNARTLDWLGNETLAGKLTLGAGPVNNMDATTKQYVDTAIGNAASITMIDHSTNTTTELNNLTINKLSQAQYNAISTPDPNQLYMITDDTIYAEKSYVDNLFANVDALPAQSGNSGKYLTTNGSTASWANVPEGVYWITATTTTSGGVMSITTDKTFAEISAAIAAGKYPLIIADANRVFQFLYINANNYIRFTRLVGDSGEAWKLNSNDTWEVDFSSKFVLSTTAGSVSQPIYLNNGVPTATDYVLGAHLRYLVSDSTTGVWDAMRGRTSEPVINVTRHNASIPTWAPGAYCSSLTFGGLDTKGLLSCAYNSPSITIGGAATGSSTADAPTWWIKLTGTTGTTYNLNNMPAAQTAASCSGNSATATSATLATRSTSLHENYPTGNSTVLTTWVDTQANVHHGSSEEVNFVRIYHDTPSTGQVPVVDSHNMVMSIDNTTNWTRILSFDIRSSDIYTRQKNSGTWQPWKRVWIEGNSVTSAVWNDYAEYRETDTQEFGRCVIENGDDTMSLSTQRLQKGCSITSDTWGFAQGQTEKAKTPIAVSGRVLAYPFEDKEEFKKHIGDAVCSGPEGTVSIMTDEEVQKYPLSIIGTISAVPDYEEWGGGSDRDPVKVNGRVWIRIK